MQMLLFLTFLGCFTAIIAAEKSFGNCFKQGQNTLVCNNVVAESDLAEDLRSTQGTYIRELVISNSSLRYIPHDAFRNTMFQVIKIQHTSLLSLSDTDIAFSGLEHRLEELHLENCWPVSHLKFRYLRNIKNLQTLYVTNSDLNLVEDSLVDVAPRLFFLKLTNNQISWIQPQAFSRMLRLSTLRLGHNEISSIQRSMFPKPAINLNLIDLSYNQLKRLPTDLFEDIPFLISLNLEGNQFVTLDQRVFDKVLPNFIVLSLEKNPLHCDCRVEWVTELKLDSSKIRAKCESPTRLRGQPVVEIERKELWC